MILSSFWQAFDYLNNAIYAIQILVAAGLHPGAKTSTPKRLRANNRFRNRIPDDLHRLKGKLIRIPEFASVHLQAEEKDERPPIALDLVVCKDARSPGPWTRAWTSPALFLKPPTSKARTDKEQPGTWRCSAVAVLLCTLLCASSLRGNAYLWQCLM